jgi:hypothetical protein
MFPSCYSQKQITPGLLASRPFCVTRRTVAGRAGRFSKTATMKRAYTRTPALTRFERKIKIAPSGCWNWTGMKNRQSYGVFWPFGGNRNRIAAHRWYYMQKREAIPRNLVCDHLCENKVCVNPDHIRITTIWGNSRRSINPATINSLKTHCIRGHEFSTENTYINKDGSRGCKACRKQRTKTK